MQETTDLPKLPIREAATHKGTYGTILVVAGSRGMTGAAILCGSGALRAGAGLVRIATSQSIVNVVADRNPCYTTIPLPEDYAGRIGTRALSMILHAAEHCQVMAIGPGLGQSLALQILLERLYHEVKVPMVLDADALNNLAGRIRKLGPGAPPRIITPHPGEFARLRGLDTRTVQQNRAQLSEEFAGEHGLVVLLKGHETIVTDGQRTYVNKTGNPGMATGGCGDVLTGTIAALVGQGLDPFAAAQLGAYVHGTAGDLARDAKGEIGMTAADVLDHLPAAFRML